MIQAAAKNLVDFNTPMDLKFVNYSMGSARKPAVEIRVDLGAFKNAAIFGYITPFEIPARSAFVERLFPV